MGRVFLTLNGAGVWAYVVERHDGLRVRFGLDDWQRLSLDVGRRVPVRRPGQADEWLFVIGATEVPPAVWVTLARRVRVPG